MGGGECSNFFKPLLLIFKVTYLMGDGDPEEDKEGVDPNVLDLGRVDKSDSLPQLFLSGRAATDRCRECNSLVLEPFPRIDFDLFGFAFSMTGMFSLVVFLVKTSGLSLVRNS